MTKCNEETPKRPTQKGDDWIDAMFTEEDIRRREYYFEKGWNPR